MNLEAFVLGCGGMMPLPYRHLTSVLLRRGGDLFLFDCGEGTQVSLRRLNLKWKKISAIFISHTHADHVTGLPGILMLSSQVERDEPLYIYGPPKIAEYIETSRKVLDMYINYPIVVKEISGNQITYSSKDFYIKSFPLFHTKPCLGYALEELPRPGIFHPEKAIKLGVPKGKLWSELQEGRIVETPTGKKIYPDEVLGEPRSSRKVSFVTDSLYDKSISKEVKGSDLLFCEGMFEADMEVVANEKKHMTAFQAAKIAKEANVKKLALLHYSPRYTDGELINLESDAKNIFEQTVLTKDRMIFDIPYED